MSQLPKNINEAVFRINTSSGTGSGFYLHSHDTIVTNFHVIQGHRQVGVEDFRQERYLAEVVYVSPGSDIAILKPATTLIKPAFSFGEFGQAANRDPVFVLGFPFGMPYTETKGIVSSARQLLDGKHFIQTDAAVNPGNSGGPVVNSTGQLLGVTTSKFTEADNVGFVIPADILQEELSHFKNKSSAFAVKCNSCNALMSTKMEYCQNCGVSVDAKSFEVVEIDQISSFVEDALEESGINPVLARCGQDYWEFHFGSTFITLYFKHREYLFAMSPINKLPSDNLERIYKYLLQKSTSNYRLGILENKIFISFRIHLADIFSSRSDDISRQLSQFPMKADEMSALLQKSFACPPSSYAREKAAKDSPPDPRTEAAQYRQKAQALINAGKDKEAFVLLKKEETILLKHPDKKSLARNYNAQAMLFHNHNKNRESLFLLKKSEDIFKELADDFDLADNLYKQSIVKESQAEYNEALTLLQRMENLYAEHPDTVGYIAFTYDKKAEVLQTMNRIDEAIDHYRKIDKIYRDLNDKPNMAENYHNHGHLLLMQGELEEALTFFKREQRLGEELKDPQILARSLLRQGDILSDFGELHDAANRYQKAASYYNETGNKNGLASCYCNWGVMYLDTQAIKEALNLFRREEQLHKSMNSRSDDLARCYLNQGIAYRNMNKVKTAMSYHQLAEKMYHQLKDEVGMADCYWSQGLVYSQMEHFAQQAKLWRTAIEIYKRHGISTGEYEMELLDLQKEFPV